MNLHRFNSTFLDEEACLRFLAKRDTREKCGGKLSKRTNRPAFTYPCGKTEVAL